MVSQMVGWKCNVKRSEVRLQVGRAEPAPNKASAAAISSDQLLFPTDRETSLLFRLHTPRRLHAWS
jgi:hypothetical protein